MDNLRLILVFSLAFILLLLWQAWNQDYGPKPLTQSEPPSSQEIPATVETPKPQAPGEVPTAPIVSAEDASSKAGVPAVTDTDPGRSVVEVLTDLYRIEIDTLGGTIRSLFLNDFPVTLDNRNEKFQLLRPTLPDQYLAQSGLIGNDKKLAPSHQAIYRAEQQAFSMEDGKDSLIVELFWQESDIAVTKRFIFNRGTYLVQIEHILENGSDKNWTGRDYRQLLRMRPGESSGGSQFIYTYTGGAIYSPLEKYEKISFDDMEDSKLERNVTDGWIAMLQHYFLAAWIPPRKQVENFYTNVYPGGRYVLGAYSPAVTIPAGTSHTFATGFVAGPKLQDELAEMATGLDLSVDYGWLTILSQPIFWLLKWIHGFLGNWGWSIILLTMLIKLAFYKLSETSYKSMANMRKMTPRIQALRDRFGDDKARLNQAMMDFYKKEKINPLGGCLPILVQIPVFIALYWVLLESVELRQAPFILWIKDLSIKDPFYILPLIMGISMFIQQKLNPAPPDPLQAKIMMSLPFVFTIFFAFFPAGLVLYWVVNNVLSIAQQWYITRKIEQAG